MTSSLTWLDYSERDRRQAMRVIDLFRETGTVDELGLAGVRDSFSDLFFPGTSTIQTRACYFLLVPWMFLEMERRGVRSSEAAGKARLAEQNLNRRLIDDRADEWGLFGRVSGEALKRLPSEVYWGGLRSWGIRTFPGSRWAYLRSLDDFHRRRSRSERTRGDREGRRPPPTNWHPNLPDPPPGFPTAGPAVALRRGDAEYLRERIQARHPQSLLAVLASRTNRSDLDVTSPWDLADLPGVSATMRGWLHDARLFAVCMQGAALVYNIMLAERRGRAAWIEKHRASLVRWAAGMEELRADLSGWKSDGVWRVVSAQGRTSGYRTQVFVNSWVEIVKRAGANRTGLEAVAAGDSARDLVQGREAQLKGGRARLTNPRRLELWGGSSGAQLMDFRWGAAKRILGDIFDWMAVSKGDAGNA